MRFRFLALLLWAGGAWPLAAVAEPEVRFQKEEGRMEAEERAARELLRAAVLHVFEPDEEFRAFQKKYRRTADVVETASLEFLRDPKVPAREFIETNSRKGAYRKPVHTPLSLVVFLKLRTREDLLSISHLRLHGRSFAIEIDQLSRKSASEAERPIWAVVEVPLGPLQAGPFHYTVHFNAGLSQRGAGRLPEGWEYSDVSRLSSSSSGCTIGDPQSDPSPTSGVPVRQSEDFTDAQIDEASERLGRLEFPASRENVYKAAGLSMGAGERLLTFGGNKTGFHTTHGLTEGEDGYRLVLRSTPRDGKTFPETIESASLFRSENGRKCILFDSRLPKGY